MLATRELKRNGVRYEAYLHETLGDYFSTLGLRVGPRGRPYTEAEVTPAPRRSSSSAKRWRAISGPDRTPSGSRSPPSTARRDTVIGVVSDAVTARLHARTAGRPLPSAAQPRGPEHPAADRGFAGGGGPALRDTMQSLDPRVRFDISLVATGLQNEVEEPRIMATLAGALAALALGLAIVGIYGVTTFVTGQRTREIGLRIAVGASRGDVLRLLLRDSLRPVAIGLAAGAVVALLASRLFAVVLYGVGASDPLAFASASRSCWCRPPRPSSFPPAAPRGWTRRSCCGSS